MYLHIYTKSYTKNTYFDIFTLTVTQSIMVTDGNGTIQNILKH